MAIPSGASRAGTCSGFSKAGYSGSSGLGYSTDATKPSAPAPATSLAHQRQRGDGSDPVGVSSRTKAAQQR